MLAAAQITFGTLQLALLLPFLAAPTLTRLAAGSTTAFGIGPTPTSFVTRS